MKLEMDKIKVYFTTDLKQNSESLDKSLTDFIKNEETGKFGALGHPVTDGDTNKLFSIEEGDYLCIVGENGSGKSTLIKAILGLEKFKSGEILFFKNRRKLGANFIFLWYNLNY